MRGLHDCRNISRGLSMFRPRTLCIRVEDFKFALAEPMSGKNFRITAFFSGYKLGRTKLITPNISNASPFIFTARPKADTPSTEAAYLSASTTMQATAGLISLRQKIEHSKFLTIWF